MTLTKKELARHLLRIKNAEESFFDYVIAIHPEWVVPDFHWIMAMALDLLEKRELKSGFTGKFSTTKTGKRVLHKSNFEGEPAYSLLINMPPRHAKTTFGTQLFPSYYMGRDPKRAILSCSYNSPLALDFGRATRAIMQEPIYSQIFPRTILDPSARAADAWRTTEGGTYYSIGLGGTTSGRPADLLLWDDPLKNRSEAESVTNRNRIWNDYISSLVSRKQPTHDNLPPIEVMILTRWHPDDPGGRIQSTKDWKNGRWVHLNFKSIYETESGVQRSVTTLPPDDPRYVPRGELRKVQAQRRHYYAPVEHALWPERFSLEELKRKRELDPREFEALYQQNPYIEGGNIIRSAWWRFYKPHTLESKNVVATVISADTAFGKKETSDYDVFMIGKITADGDIYIVDLIRERFEYPDLKAKAIALNTIYRGQALRGLYVEDRSSGTSLIQDLRDRSGMIILPYRPGTTDKVSRAKLITPLIHGGRVFLPEGAPWIDDFTAECEAFPDSKNDDQVDALVILLDTLSRIYVPEDHANALSFSGGASLNQIASTTPPKDTRPNDTRLPPLPKATLSHKPWKGWGN